MDLAKEESQREEFRNILLELSSDEKLLQDESMLKQEYMRLEALYYNQKYRHLYSEIFSVLVSLQNGSATGSIDILGQNIRILWEKYNPQNKENDSDIIDISDSIRKLYDHVSLDIARISFSNAGDWKTSGEKKISEVQTQINLLQNKIDEAKDNQKKAEEELKKQQKEYIAILGIFAAVVLTFTGGIAFSTSVLNNINTVSVYRIIVVALIIGLVLLNVLFGLFSYIDRLVNGTGENQNKVKPLICPNVIMGVLLFLTLAAWLWGLVENRDDRLDRNYPKAEVEEAVEQSEKMDDSFALDNSANSPIE